jgi:hypothetical protein
MDNRSALSCGLLPGSSALVSISDGGRPEPKPELETEIRRFLHEVICDGRFVDEVGRDPEFVAAELRFSLSRETADRIRRESLDRHLDELVDTRFAALPAFLVIVLVIGIVAIIVVVIAWKYSTESRPSVKDFSPHKDLKL